MGSAVILLGLITAATPAATALCAGEGVAVFADFDGAGVASCRVEPDGTVVARIEPETRPVNPSPWYAMRLVQERPAPRSVRLDYATAAHRYHPWWRADRAWQRLADATQVDDGRSATVRLPRFAGSAVLSAQPLTDLDALNAFWRRMPSTAVTGARSAEGRALQIHRRGGDGPAHLFVARQHPPETTGAAAFDAFAARLLDRVGIATASAPMLIFVPIANPDGIAHGNWRGNAAGADLNRDWGVFAHPETTAIRDALAGRRLASVVDFHSTSRSVLNVARRVVNPAAARFAERLAAETGLTLVPTRAANGTTLKSWAERTHDASAFTLEVADGATPAEAAAIGRAAADIYITTMLTGAPR